MLIVKLAGMEERVRERRGIEEEIERWRREIVKWEEFSR
jgi:hypothetical protein